MAPNSLCSRTCLIVGCVMMSAITIAFAQAQQPPPRFGGGYAALDERRQQLVKDWVARFNKITGQTLDAPAFYDDVMGLSTRTTFDAVTHALSTTPLTDQSGANLGDALGLIERVESVKGEVPGAPGDHQFRIYVRLTADALDRLARSQQFKRGVDNTVYHKGYPTNYRGQGGTPSIQISVALDRRRADIDVDYRASSFPVGLFNGHLTSSNSDVRAGENYDRHTGRWNGFQNWWRSFFGVRQERAPEAVVSSTPLALPKAPRAGNKNIDAMVNDFLTAWLVEGDVVAAMGYVSERSYACLAHDLEDPSSFDRGLAPFQLMVNLKSAHDTLGSRSALDQVVAASRINRPELRTVQQPHQAQFVIYSVPDDVAAAFDCESQLRLGDPKQAKRTYGNFFGASFLVKGQRDSQVALLWAKDSGYWKIVSWKVGGDDAMTTEPDPIPDTRVTRIDADPTLVQAARGFLENWLVRKDYDAAFAYVSSKAYQCYDLERDRAAPPPASIEDAGRRLRANLENSGKSLGDVKDLEQVLSSVEPIHPAFRIMNHRFSRIFSLTSVPNALADVYECAARAGGAVIPDSWPPEYGAGFGMTVRFKMRSGDTPVLRLLWRKENGAWRITSYGIEQS
jgi:hypothetical protein